MAVFGLVLCLMNGVLDVWTESPLVRVFPASVRTSAARDDVRLYAARGERESFQLCIRTEDQDVASLAFTPEALDSAIGPPAMRRVGFLQVTTPGSSGPNVPNLPWPDPLLDLRPFPLAPGETCAMWVTYDVPRDCPAGVHRGRLTFTPEGGRTVYVKVAIEVFGFTVPEEPSLHAVFQLDRRAARTVLAMDNPSLESWSPLYDSLQRERLALRLWDGDPLVSIGTDGIADTARFKEHIAYTMARLRMGCIDIGAGENGLAPFPEPAPAERQDPLQFYLHDMGNWLQEKGWLDRAWVQPTPLRPRAEWQWVRDACFRVKRNDPRIRRFLVAPPHPFFERYAELWATALWDFNPYAADRLVQGESFTAPSSAPALLVRASSAGALGGEPCRGTLPDDAYDSSLFSYWLSQATPSPDRPEWLEVALQKPVNPDSLRVIWRLGFESEDITVRLSLDGDLFDVAEMRWDPYPAASPFTQSWARGVFRSPKPFTVIRFEFATARAQAPVGVTEILFSDDAQPPESVPPAEPWLGVETGAFPSLAVNAHPVEARLWPWVCWGHDIRSLLGGTLNRWPDSWAAFSVDLPLTWPARDFGAAWLFYPRQAPSVSPSGEFVNPVPRMMPSIRSESLRDGMEDYEYLQALDEAVARKEITRVQVIQLCKRMFYPPDPPPPAFDDWARDILRRRVEIGRALSALEKRRQP